MAGNDTRGAESPFVLTPESESAFRACPTLRAVREYLSSAENRCVRPCDSRFVLSITSFCEEHAKLPATTQEAYLLNRDVIHALIIPVAALYTRSATLASAALCSSRAEDLEIAYKEDARTAFVLLQCLVQEEAAWCFGRGCSACLVLHTLESQATIRMAIAGALMANEESTTEQGTAPAQLSTFLPAIAHAVESDPFWGREYYANIISKAESLRSGIQCLIAQAGDLEVLVRSPTRGRSPPSRSLNRSPWKNKTLLNDFAASHPQATAPVDGTDIDQQRAPKRVQTLPRLDPSPLAKRQLRLEQEQREVLSRMAWQVYSAVALPASEQMKQRQHSRRLVGFEKLLR